MSGFFDPKPADGSKGHDRRLYAPATGRNRDIILNVLKAHAPDNGTLLELASGTGEHAVFIAPHLDDIFWQPTDIDEEKLHSIDAWRSAAGAKNVLPARHFDVLGNDFSALELPAPLTAVMAINLIHIAPWTVAEAMVEKTSDVLEKDGMLFLYGPFKRGGMHTAPSNENFDISLKSRDATWGVRDLEAVCALADGAGFGAPTIIEMPANNLSLVFKKS